MEIQSGLQWLIINDLSSVLDHRLIEMGQSGLILSSVDDGLAHMTALISSLGVDFLLGLDLVGLALERG